VSARQIVVRVNPKDRVDERVSALVALIQSDEGFAAVRISAAAVLRMILFEGLKTIEARYGVETEE